MALSDNEVKMLEQSVLVISQMHKVNQALSLEVRELKHTLATLEAPVVGNPERAEKLHEEFAEKYTGEAYMAERNADEASNGPLFRMLAIDPEPYPVLPVPRLEVRAKQDQNGNLVWRYCLVHESERGNRYERLLSATVAPKPIAVVSGMGRLLESGSLARTIRHDMKHLQMPAFIVHEKQYCRLSDETGEQLPYASYEVMRGGE